MRRGAALLASLLLLASAAGCERIDRNMWDNPAPAPQKGPVRLPPPDSVPTKGLVRNPTPAEALSLVNPVAGSEPDAAKGKELFTVFCLPCHGEKGKGDGPVGKKLRPMPADIGPGGVAAGMPDGATFGVITNGSGGMPSLAPDLLPLERWQVVAYLRTIK